MVWTTVGQVGSSEVIMMSLSPAEEIELLTKIVMVHGVGLGFRGSHKCHWAEPRLTRYRPLV